MKTNKIFSQSIKKLAEEFLHPLLEEVDRFVQKESAGNNTFAS